MGATVHRTKFGVLDSECGTAVRTNTCGMYRNEYYISEERLDLPVTLGFVELDDWEDCPAYVAGNP